MKIKTKYSVNDVVIIIGDGTLVLAQIAEVEFNETMYIKRLKYRVMTINNSPFAEEKWIDEQDICCKYPNRKAKRLILKHLLKVIEKGETNG